MNLDELERTRADFEYDISLISTFDPLKRQLLQHAMEYLMQRVAWALADQSERATIDVTRSRAHNAFLATLNILTRNAANSGAKLEWRRRFAIQGQSQERKGLGDFACYLAFHTSIMAR